MKYTISGIIALIALVINGYKMYRNYNHNPLEPEKDKNLKVVTGVLLMIAIAVVTFGDYFGL